MKVVLPALLFSIVVLAPRLASPCSPGCSTYVIAPGEGEVVPANIPAVVVALRSGPGQYQGAPTWVDQAGVAVQFDDSFDGRWRLLKPSVPLVPGTRYSVSVPIADQCGGIAEQARQFVAGPSELLPAESPLVELQSLSVTSIHTARSGSCDGDVPAAVARLKLTGLELGGFRSTAVLETMVDGGRWAVSLPGEAELPKSISPTPFDDWKSTLVLFSGCPPDDGWSDMGLDQGHHSVALRIVVPGAPPGPLSTPLELTLSCGSEADDGLTSSDIPEATLADDDLADTPDEGGFVEINDAPRNGDDQEGALDNVPATTLDLEKPGPGGRAGCAAQNASRGMPSALLEAVLSLLALLIARRRNCRSC